MTTEYHNTQLINIKRNKIGIILQLYSEHSVQNLHQPRD